MELIMNVLFVAAIIGAIGICIYALVRKTSEVGTNQPQVMEAEFEESTWNPPVRQIPAHVGQYQAIPPPALPGAATAPCLPPHGAAEGIVIHQGGSTPSQFNRYAAERARRAYQQIDPASKVSEDDYGKA